MLGCTANCITPQLGGKIIDDGAGYWRDAVIRRPTSVDEISRLSSFGPLDTLSRCRDVEKKRRKSYSTAPLKPGSAEPKSQSVSLSVCQLAPSIHLTLDG